MNSAYDAIRMDHLALLASIASLAEMIKTIPVLKNPSKSATMKAVAAGDSAPAEGSEPKDPNAAPAPGGNIPAEAVAVTSETAPPPETWDEQERAKSSFADFRKALLKHFANEEEFAFAGILMTLKTKSACTWIFKRINEHGIMTEMTDHILRMIDCREMPVSRRSYNEITNSVDSLRALMLQHALEEDTKIGKLLRDNPSIVLTMKKLLTK